MSTGNNRTNALLAVLLAATMTFAGCLTDSGDDGDGERRDQDPPPVEPEREVGAPPPADEDVPEEHGEPVVTEGPISVRQQGSDYIATRNVTITNGFGDATRATVSMQTTNGGMAVGGTDQGGYYLVAVLFARAPTEQQARDDLEEMEVSHHDSKTGATIDLSFAVTIRRAGGLLDEVPIDLGATGSRGGFLHLFTPGDASYALDLDGTNGGIVVQGVSGSRVTAEMTNGGIHLGGVFTTATLDNTNGGVSVRVPASSDHGYDVDARNTNGGIAIDLPDVEPVGAQDDGDHEHVRTRGFDQRPIQMTMQLTNTNGGVTVTGSG